MGGSSWITGKNVANLALVWFGLAWLGLAWFGLVWFGLVVGCDRKSIFSPLERRATAAPPAAAAGQ